MIFSRRIQSSRLKNKIDSFGKEFEQWNPLFISPGFFLPFSLSLSLFFFVCLACQFLQVRSFRSFVYTWMNSKVSAPESAFDIFLCVNKAKGPSSFVRFFSRSIMRKSFHRHLISKYY